MRARLAVRTSRQQTAARPRQRRRAEPVRAGVRAAEAEESASNHLRLALQAKLRVAPAGDEREREADRMAARVMSAPRAVQRKCACGAGKAGECEECRPKSGGAVQRSATGGLRRVVVPSIVERVIGSPGRPLDGATRAFMEPRLGRDFRDVRIHTDGRAGASARAIEARAYTVGRHIAFDRGEFAPTTEPGRRLLAHELTHVVQQNGISGETAFREEKGKKPNLGAGLKHPDAFWEWWKKVAGFEGTVGDWEANKKFNVNDRGGRTNLGITRGTFTQYHNVASLPDTDEAFDAMTVEQASLIGRSFWKKSHADELSNPGVAIIVCDWYWGSTSYAFVEIKKRLAAMGYFIDKDKKFLTEGKYNVDDLDPDTIAVMNTIPPATLTKALTEQRLDHYARIAADPTQKNFEKGWFKRANERQTQAEELLEKDSSAVQDAHVTAAQDFRRAMAKPDLAAAVTAIKDFTADQIEHEFKLLSKKNIAELHEAAVKAGLTDESTLVSVSRYRRLVYRLKSNMEAQNWVEAAWFLNYFGESEIKEFIAPLKKKPDQLKALHEAAATTRGEGSNAARLTAGVGQ